MGQPRRRVRWAFKVEAVHMTRAAGRSVADVARELGIRPDLRHEWRRAVVAQEARATPAPGGALPPPAERPEAEGRRRREGLAARRRRRFRVTTQSRHAHPVAPNVLARRLAVGAPNQVWAGDITSIPTREGWLYLAVRLDLGSRRVVGWALRPTLERSLTLAALGMALVTRRLVAGGRPHADRGSQYACGEYRTRLAAHGVTVSMSRTGDCWDNAVVERVFKTLTTELVDEADWTTRVEAEAAIIEYLETWYNTQRRHSTLGYLSPIMYELRQRAA